MNKKILITSCLSGTILEWFDFSLFGVLTPVLSVLFFPADEGASSLIKILLIFAIGFVVRPVAAIFWGLLGDHIGRKKTIIFTINMMAASSLLIAFLPTYQMIGMCAPILLLLLRILQGFSASGEHAGMLTYLYESAEANSRRLWSSIGIAGVFLGMALSTYLVFVVTTFLKESFIIWGWRLLFLLSAAMGVVSYFLRKQAKETIAFQSMSENMDNQFTAKDRLKKIIGARREIIKAIGIFQLAVTVPYVVFVFSVAQTLHQHILPKDSVYVVTLINLLLTAGLVLLFAYWADKTNINFRLLAIIGMLLGGIFLLPGMFSSRLDIYALVQCYFGVFTAMLVGPFSGCLAERFEVKIRFSAVAICFNFSAALFGGFAPVLMSFFQLTKYPMFFSSSFMVMLCLIALVSEILFRKEKTICRRSSIILD